MLFVNEGGRFIAKPLPDLRSSAPSTPSQSEDVDGDGAPEMIVAGNTLRGPVEIDSNDAGVGAVLKRQGDGSWRVLSMAESGFAEPGMVRSMAVAGDRLIVGNNNGPVGTYRLRGAPMPDRIIFPIFGSPVPTHGIPLRPRDRAEGAPATHRHDGRTPRHRCGRPRTLRPLQGEAAALTDRRAQGGDEQAHPGHRAQPHAGGRRQDHHQHRPERRPEQAGQEERRGAARAQPRSRLRHEGRRGGRRLCAGGADGGHQPALHRRLRGDREGQQPARARSSTTTCRAASAAWASIRAPSAGSA